MLKTNTENPWINLEYEFPFFELIAAYKHIHI